jgi:hypothetical protein
MEEFVIEIIIHIIGALSGLAALILCIYWIVYGESVPVPEKTVTIFEVKSWGGIQPISSRSAAALKRIS